MDRHAVIAFIMILLHGMTSELLSDTNVNPVKVKLTGTDDVNVRGRVDIYYKGKWGTLCVRDMNKDVASLVCKALGYNTHLARPANGRFYQQERGSGHFWVLDGCEGTELSIADCALSGLQSSPQCTERYDHTEVGVDCNPKPDPRFQVRLVGGSGRSSGTVEVYHGGRWGTICGKSWKKEEAKVVCRQLGYVIGSTMALTVAPNHTVPGRADAELWLSSVKCTGDETTLRNCVHGPWGDLTCGRGGRAAVECEPGKNPTQVRLVGGQMKREGWVQVKLMGRWADLMNSGWNGYGATDICRYLGYIWGSSMRKQFGGSEFTESSWITDAKCNGHEHILTDCANTGWILGKGQKYSTSQATATCYKDSPRPPVPIISGWTSQRLVNASVYMTCQPDEMGQVSIRWVCNGATHVRAGPSLGDKISLPLEIRELTPEHNTLKCECLLASSRGWIVSQSRKLDVIFDPVSVHLKQDNVAKEGEIFGIECRTDLSNPAVDLTWYNGTTIVELPGKRYTKAYTYGIYSFQRWHLRAEKSMNGNIITCVARNPKTGNSVFDSIVLVVGTDIPIQGRLVLSVQHLASLSPSSFLTFLKSSIGSCYNGSKYRQK